MQMRICFITHAAINAKMAARPIETLTKANGFIPDIQEIKPQGKTGEQWKGAGLKGDELEANAAQAEAALKKELQDQIDKGIIGKNAPLILIMDFNLGKTGENRNTAGHIDKFLTERGIPHQIVIVGTGGKSADPDGVDTLSKIYPHSQNLPNVKKIVGEFLKEAAQTLKSSATPVVEHKDEAGVAKPVTKPDQTAEHKNEKKADGHKHKKTKAGVGDSTAGAFKGLALSKEQMEKAAQHAQAASAVQEPGKPTAGDSGRKHKRVEEIIRQDVTPQKIPGPLTLRRTSSGGALKTNVNAAPTDEKTGTSPPAKKRRQSFS